MAGKAVPEMGSSPFKTHKSHAFHLMEADVNPFFIRDILGHADIKTTGIYARSSIKTKKAALEKINNSKQDPLPVQNNDKNWTADKDLMEWLKGLG